MASPAGMTVEVCYAEAERARVAVFALQAPASIADVLRLAATDAQFAGIDLEYAPVGVYGRIVQRDTAVQNGDRIEIYRPLKADPKNTRRLRARSERQRSQSSTTAAGKFSASKSGRS